MYKVNTWLWNFGSSWHWNPVTVHLDRIWQNGNYQYVLVHTQYLLVHTNTSQYMRVCNPYQNQDENVVCNFGGPH